MLNLTELYQKKVSSIDKVETFRLQQQMMLEQGQRWFLLPALLIAVGLSLFFLGKGPIAALVCGLSLIVFFLIGALKILPAYTRFNDQFKRKVLYALLEDLYPSVYYAPDNYVPSSLFSKAQLYPVGGNYTGEDYVEGETNHGATFKFSALTVQATLADDHALQQIFQGLFLVIDVHLKSNYPIYILPTNTDMEGIDLTQFIQQPLEDFISSDQVNSYVEHPEFGKKFTVYTLDKEVTTVLLKEPLIEVIYKWYSQWGCETHLSWIGQQLFIALPSATIFPTADLTQKVEDNTALHYFYDQLLYGLSLVEFFGRINTPKSNIGNDSTFKKK
ncbi:MAG: DUF3137 domain-containing protein [Aureispira sp.]